MNFKNLGLHPKILKAVTEAGYNEPTQIQSDAIPQILEGHDIKASAQTGTGKTGAFLLPMLSSLATEEGKPGHYPKALILAPTRELAVQIATQAHKYSKYLPRMKSVCVYGGMPYPAQIRQLKRPYEILIATPGRLIDLLDRGVIDLSAIEILVLDEADRMLDMGFVEPVEKIVSHAPESRQTLLFSATMRGGVGQLSKRLLKSPVTIEVHSDNEKHENITQTMHYVDDLRHKDRLLDHILSDTAVGHAIVFTSTKRHADQLASGLQDKGHKARALHGDMNQRQRDRTLSQLRTGQISVLVATDVAARGIDVQSITHVINYDLPRNVEDYVHRIGRTGRAGAEGIALSFAADKDAMLVRKIEQYTGQRIDVREIAGFEPSPRKKSWQPKSHPNRPSGPGGKRPKAGGFSAEKKRFGRKFSTPRRKSDRAGSRAAG